ncbi:MAG: ABC transporter permease subunit [Roseburia inulinivorans]
MDEAATIDGAGFFRTFFMINLPLAKSGLSTAGILMFLGNWNEYFYAALLTSSEKNRTLPVALQFFNQSLSYDYTKMFAALTLVVVPAIIVYCFWHRSRYRESVAASGIKRLIKENEAMPKL